MRTELRQHFLELIYYRSLAELRAEASRAYLGMAWWVFEPLLYLVVFANVMGAIKGDAASDDFLGFPVVTFLLTGLVPWRWFANTVLRGTTSIQSSSSLMSQVYLPKFMFPSIVMLTNLVKFSFILGLLLLYLALFGPGVLTTWLALPVVLAVQFVLIAACTWLVAALVPFLPDLKMLIENLLIALLFLSGTFYNIANFDSPEAQFWFRLNPMALLLEAYREILLSGIWPSWGVLGVITLGSGVVLFGAGYILVRFDRVYPKIVIG